MIPSGLKLGESEALTYKLPELYTSSKPAGNIPVNSGFLGKYKSSKLFKLLKDSGIEVIPQLSSVILFNEFICPIQSGNPFFPKTGEYNLKRVTWKLFILSISAGNIFSLATENSRIDEKSAEEGICKLRNPAIANSITFLVTFQTEAGNSQEGVATRYKYFKFVNPEKSKSAEVIRDFESIGK